MVHHHSHHHGHDAKEQASLITALRDRLAGTDTHSQLVAGGEEGLTELTLRRWLVARKWDVDAAQRDLVKHAAWRAAFAPLGLVSESDVAAEASQDKVFLLGPDRLGRGTVFLIVARHPISTNLAATRRFITFVIDAAIACCDAATNPDGKLACVMDLRGMGVKNGDTAALRDVFLMLQEHYVERLGALYFYCAPTLFWALWKVVKPFVDPVTAKKINFVYEKEAQDIFSNVLGWEILPACLHPSGRAQLQPILVSRRQLLEQQKLGGNQRLVEEAAPAPQQLLPANAA